MGYARAKRWVDVAVSATGLVVLSAPMIAIAIAIRVSMGRPVLFRQARPGLGGDIFTMYKFRTMRDTRDEQGRLLPDGQRATRLGLFLRAFSLDELPELFNVLGGDMSLVGPRPLLPEYLGRYSTRQAMRHYVRPGITGLSQVMGRNALTWERKLELDAVYAESCSPWLDARILLRTFGTVLMRRGINQAGLIGAEPFQGGVPDTRSPSGP